MTIKPARKSISKKKTATKSSPDSEFAEAKRQIEKLMAGGELVSQDDLNALLSSLQGPSATDGLSDEEADAKAQAQEFAFDAMEAETEADARKLAKRALRLDPDCVDALVVMADLDARSTKDRIAGLQNAVAAGERSLGAKFIRKNTGHFWGLIETRPYMRALEQLATLLRGVGLNLDAAKHYERMLTLNPNDNQGVREPLLGIYLATSNLEGARKLLKKYGKDSLATFAWCRVLERFLSGDEAGAAAALRVAREANHFVELYMTGQRALPKEMPEMYSMGSDEEAVMVLDNMSLAWAEHKEAVFWLMDQLMAGKPQKKATAKPGQRVQ
jgi:tetratricopeptide (TPR) repeat protein